MSKVYTAPYPFEKTADGRWVVYMDGGNFTVQTCEDAELVASVKVESDKFASDSMTKPDLARARRVFETCKAYGMYAQFGVRQLERRICDYERNGR